MSSAFILALDENFIFFVQGQTIFADILEDMMNITWLKQIGLICIGVALLLSPLNITPAHALSAPGLLAPLNGTNTTAIDTPPVGIPEFSWNSVAGATLYRLQVSSDIAFTTQFVNILHPASSQCFSRWRVVLACQGRSSCAS